MVVFPNAKVNLGLHVLRKRTDGFHDIETCFYPIPLCDVLEVVLSESLKFDQTGLVIPGNSDDNLILKAYRLMQVRHGISPVHIHLHKIVPMGAGLGGGSSDAAYMLKALNSVFDLSLSVDTLEEYAAELGSDCSFFIRNTPAIGKGRGTDLSPVELSLKDKYFTLIHPGVHISTAEAYSSLTPNESRPPVRKLINLPIDQWRTSLGNDFTSSIYPQYKEIAKIEEMLYTAGADYARMSGSGSSVFGISESPLELDIPDHHFTWQGRLS